MNAQDGITVILVTHDQDIARNTRRRVVLRDGEVVVDSYDFHQAVAALHAGSPVTLEGA